jgi:protoheme IX farnesyltransferase
VDGFKNMTDIQLEREHQTDATVTDIHDFWLLLKPRVMSLVIFTALVGLVRADGDIHIVLAFTTILCIAIGAGASGALNMYYDVDIDRLMSRTAQRPIASGRVRPGDALSFGIALSVASVLMLGLNVSWMGAGLLAFTIFFYAVVYTVWLKRATPQNIVIGGLAGALPPLVSWVSVTQQFSWEPIVMVAIIFMWTPPHFWALSLFKEEDYRAAGVPMMPIVHGQQHTKLQILLYSLLLWPIGLLPWYFGWTGNMYGVIAAIVGLWFCWSCGRLYMSNTDLMIKRAKQCFGVSIVHLFVLFAALLIDGVFDGF